MKTRILLINSARVSRQTGEPNSFKTLRDAFAIVMPLYILVWVNHSFGTTQ